MLARNNPSEATTRKNLTLISGVTSVKDPPGAAMALSALPSIT